MILLTATTEILRIITTTTAGIDYTISYSDIGLTTFNPSSAQGTISTGTTTTVLSAPATSVQRQVKLITIINRDVTSSNTVVVLKETSGPLQYYLTSTITLLAGESMQYVDTQGWIFYTASGAQKLNKTTAKGADTNVQFNDGGLISGDPGLTYDKTNDILKLNTVTSAIQIAGDFTAPSSPPARTLSIFARQIANRMMTAQVGPSGLDCSLQPFLARNKIGYWNPPGNATTAPGIFGITTLTANGTATSRTVATTNLATRMRRIGYPSTTTAGTFAGARLPVAQFSCGSGSADGTGFMVIERWVESNPAVVSGRRAFHGVCPAGAFSNVEVNTLLNLVGICQLSTDATQWYWIASGSSAQSAVAVGTSIGAPGGNSTTAWELAIFAPNGIANTYYLQLTNITTGAFLTRTVTGSATICPQSSTLLAYNSWATNNGTALATGIDICSLYFETDS